MRFNSLNGSPSFQPQPSCAMNSISLIGDILVGPNTSYTCSKTQAAGVTYSYDAFTNTNGVACGIGNLVGVTAPTTWNNPANYDYSLKSTSRAVNLVPMTVPYPENRHHRNHTAAAEQSRRRSIRVPLARERPTLRESMAKRDYRALDCWRRARH